MTTDTVMIGDLCRDWYDKDVRVAEYDCGCCTLIAKGPGWVKHDGSSVNPVPGARCDVFRHGLHLSEAASEEWTWDAIQFYRVTKTAPVEAPKIKPGSKVTVELECVEDRGRMGVDVRWPNGGIMMLGRGRLAGLDWLPPAPVLRVGGLAEAVDGDTVTVKYIGKRHAFVEDATGEEWLPAISSLTPLEDEG